MNSNDQNLQPSSTGSNSTSDDHSALASYAGPDRVILAEEHAKLVEASQGRLLNFRTQIESLDKMIDGAQTGELVAIGGPPKNGKTLLAQTLTNSFASQGLDVLWFSFEVPARQFYGQIGKVKFYVPARLKDADLKWLETRLLEGKLKYDTRIIFIDHLHYLVDLLTARNISLDIGRIVRSLKRMAIEHNLIIFILCHSRKPEVNKKTGKIQEVSMWDMRDSSFIPQESDATIMVQRSTTNLTMVKVCCHRRTGVIDEKFLMGKKDRFLEELDVTETMADGDDVGRSKKKSWLDLDLGDAAEPDPD